MRRIFWVLAMVLSLSLAVGCSSSGESAQQKLDDFKKAHGAIYDAWKAETMPDLQSRLGAGLVDPLLTEQVQQQSKVMQQRLMMNEKHIVKQITYNKLEMLTTARTISQLAQTGRWTAWSTTATFTKCASPTVKNFTP